MTKLKDITEPLASINYVSNAINDATINKLDNIAENDNNKTEIEIIPGFYKLESFDENNNDATYLHTNNSIALKVSQLSNESMIYLQNDNITIANKTSQIVINNDGINMTTETGNFTIDNDGNIYTSNKQLFLLTNLLHTNQSVSDDNKLATMADLANLQQLLQNDN